MRFQITSAVSFAIAFTACACAQDETVRAPRTEVAPHAVAQPMASFARMVEGEWKMTALAGTSTFDVWRWGPGKRSTRVRTDGIAPDGSAWDELQVYFWHPRRAEIRILGFSPYARGIAQGALTFDGDRAEGTFDLHQATGRRELALRWTFDGPDSYRDELLEKGAAGVYEPMNEWRHVRIPSRTTRSDVRSDTSRLPEQLAPFAPLLGKTWSAVVPRASVDALRITSTVEWIPSTAGLYARVVAASATGEPEHLFDVYACHHTGANELRCLALAHDGSVYEGAIEVLDGGALRLDLRGDDGEKLVERRVQLDLERDGKLRQRVWDASGRESLLDVRHASVATRKD